MNTAPRSVVPAKAGLQFIFCASLLAGCATTRDDADGFPDHVPIDIAALPDATPRSEPRSRYGNPASYKVAGREYRVLPTASGYRERGHASWYGKKFHGRRTSSGETYDMFAMTAAHKTLPLPTYVRVTHLGNGRSIIVKVNDRGPFHPDRIIDLSYAAAAKLDLLEHGSAMVEVEALLTDDGRVPGSTPAFLQVGAFRDLANAASLRDELVGRGVQSVAVRSGERDGAPLHRVLVGPFRDTANLESARAKLGSAHERAIVVVE